jgi:2-polyprenyl-3-methyl-5-hydroxy-6-metoxy-1,4-benzoquinol methylase
VTPTRIQNVTQHYEATPHRTDATPFQAVQSNNQAWWTSQTMSYDWGEKNKFEKFSLPWYDEIDRRFAHDARLFAHDKQPFDRIIPFDEICGKKVLEIGCGMGLHTELMTRAGAEVTSVDLSETSVQATRTRLKLKGLAASIIQGDAESLAFEPGSFDFIWSWGVIHHSSRTAKIVRDIARILRPDGWCRIMVYNRYSGTARIALLKYHWLRMGFLYRSVDESLNMGSDGYHARHYTKDQFEDLFRAFFTDVNSLICGQDVDALLLPRGLRKLALRVVSNRWLQRAQSSRGWFLFLEAKNPISYSSP